jgi:phytanoyl-CoA hydroxylase
VLHPMKPHADPRFDPSGESFDFAPFDADGGTAVEVKAGDVVWFNGYTLHRSLANTTTDQYRRALVVHYMSAESLLPWDCDGAIPPTQVAGPHPTYEVTPPCLHGRTIAM